MPSVSEASPNSQDEMATCPTLLTLLKIKPLARKMAELLQVTTWCCVKTTLELRPHADLDDLPRGSQSWVCACTCVHASQRTSTAWSHQGPLRSSLLKTSLGPEAVPLRPFWVLGARSCPVCPYRTLTCAPNPAQASPGSPFSPLNPFIPGRPWEESRGELLGAGQDLRLCYHLSPHQDRPSPLQPHTTQPSSPRGLGPDTPVPTPASQV